MTKEEQLLCKRFKEYALLSYNKGFNTYTDFLNMNEISLLYNIKHELPTVEVDFYGGYDEAERKIACFHGNEYEYTRDFPISCVHIQVKNEKFSDVLTHRDYLGAVLNLGIERFTIGDIVVQDKDAYLFCTDKMSGYIIDNLTKIKHTNVRCTYVESFDQLVEQQYQTIRGTVASIRLDSILSVAFSSSRSSITNVIKEGKVFVNSRLIESTSYVLKEGDIVSARGYGKFIFQEQQNQTKKGRYFIVIKKYT